MASVALESSLSVVGSHDDCASLQPTKLPTMSSEVLVPRTPLQGVSNLVLGINAKIEEASADDRLPSKRGGQELEPRAEESSSDSDSDLEADGLARPHHITERRRTQNAKFSSWYTRNLCWQP